MHRRDFLISSSSLLALSTLPASAESLTPAQPRTVLPLNRNWRFKPAFTKGSELPGFDDSSFHTVVLPHTNATVPWHNFSDKDYEFVSTYRRSFRMPRQAKGMRVFIDFEAAMTASTVWINGHLLGEYKGGFTPFSFELTEHLQPLNVLVVRLDSTERPDIPPFGNEIDYLTFGGIYREVSLRIVPPTYIDNLFARPQSVLTTPTLDADVFLTTAAAGQFTLRLDLLEDARIIATRLQTVMAQPIAAAANATADAANPGPVHLSTEDRDDPARHTVSLNQLPPIKLWDLKNPFLYSVRATLLEGTRAIDQVTTRIGFREAIFTDHGFRLNGKALKLRGLDRHQTFPFVGQAMPARVQRKDADILRHELHCNIVRTSHYPQSRHFLDRCDEIGLLVLEEIPGWQHIGPEPWKQIAIDNVGRMIRRDWNRPSIILWGVRINESPDDDSFYTRTNALAKQLDPTRQTGGIRNRLNSHLIEDVFTINDFGFPLQTPNHPLYLNTEFVGHTYPVKLTDNNELQREHTLRHARIHDQIAGDDRFAGGIGWCAFDYNTHANFGAGDRMCYHGVMDIFRTPKAAAGFYKSQCDPDEEVVLEPAFHWARGDEPVDFTKAVVCSNCDHLKFYLHVESEAAGTWHLLAELDPDHAEFPHLAWPPFILDVKKADMHRFSFPWGDLRIDGYLKGQQVISKTLSGQGVNQRFVLLPDDHELLADGADSTRIVLRVTDEFGAPRPLSDEPVTLSLTGPADLIGGSPFTLCGGTGAVWIRARQQAGAVRLTAAHPRLGNQTVDLRLTATTPEEL
jgi:beta-galactosidase